MIITSKVCKSIMKKNKSFTIGLLIMSVLTMAIGLMGLNIGDTAKGSLTDFINFSNLPDTLYTTELISTEAIDSLKSLDGVKTVESRFAYESKFELRDDEAYPARVFTYDTEGSYQIAILEEIEINTDLVKAYVPVRFARAHGIVPGDKLQIHSPFGPIDSMVKGLAASADGFFPSKDFMSSHEGYSYCYVYVDQTDFNRVFDAALFANQFLLYFKDGISSSLQNEILQKADDVFGANLLSKKTFDRTKKNLLSYEDDINTISMLGCFFAVLILIITLGFNFIFIQIIIKKEGKTIGLLRALGYSKFQIVKLFCLYTVLINLVAMVIGFLVGFGLLALAAFAISFNQGIPNIGMSISPLSLIITAALSFLCGIVSAILSASAISKIDPSEAYGKQVEFNSEPIKVLSHIKGHEFLKISLTSLFRNIRRQIVAALSIAACITFMVAGLEGFGTTANITESLYGKRLLCDIAIRNINEEGYLKIINNVAGIEIIEPNIYFEAKINDEYLAINAIEDDCRLVKLYDSNNREIHPKEGIVIDEVTAQKSDFHIGDFIEVDGYSLQIDGIAREIISPVSYISLDTANKMGRNSINGAMVKVEDSSDINRVFKDIFNLDESFYLVRNSDQYNYLRDLYTQVQASLAILSSIAFVIGTLLIANMSFVDFLETKGKYATLRAVGYSPSKLTKINLIQNLFRIFVGAIIALPLSYTVGKTLISVLSSDSTQFIFVGFFPFFGISVAISLIYVLIGVLLSFVNIKKLDLVKNLNAGE